MKTRSVGNRLLCLREALGLSQSEIATEFQVTAGEISAWEKGANPIPGPVMKLIDIYTHEVNLYPQANGTLSECELTDLVTLFATSVKVSNAELLEKLRTSLLAYMRVPIGENPVRRHVQLLAFSGLAQSLGEARGLPMKVAQYLAFFDPSVPAELRDALADIQYSGCPMSMAQVEQIMRAEFHQELHQLFSEFPERPVAMASIGQVHKARLPDGRTVAVKIQYPEIKDRIRNDFSDFEFVRQVGHLIPGSCRELLLNLQATAIGECDYLREAENQIEIRRLIENDSSIVVPRIIQSHSRSRVLTSEWIDGQDWASFKASASERERSRAANTISRFIGTTVFSRGIFNADLHPKNFLFQDGKVAFLDFGRIIRLTPAAVADFRALHTAILSGEKAQLKDYFRKTVLFRFAPGRDFDEFLDLFQEIFAHLHGDESVRITPEIVARHREIFRQISASGAIELTPEVFWAGVMTHAAMISLRADLNASSNWRQELSRAMQASSGGPG